MSIRPDESETRSDPDMRGRRRTPGPRGASRWALLLGALAALWGLAPAPEARAQIKPCEAFTDYPGSALPRVNQPGESCRSLAGNPKTAGQVTVSFYAGTNDLAPNIAETSATVANILSTIVDFYRGGLFDADVTPATINVYFSTIRTSQSGGRLALARTSAVIDQNVCHIVIFADDGSPPHSTTERPGDKMSATLAHEYFHCITAATSRPHVAASGSRWWEEGMAEAFSTAFMGDPAETAASGARFHALSKDRGMVDQTYDNEPFLAWVLDFGSWARTAPASEKLLAFLAGTAVAPSSTPQGDDREPQVVALSKVMTRDDASRFMRAYADGTLRSLAGVPYGGPPPPQGAMTVTVNGSMSPEAFNMPPFGALNYVLSLDMAQWKGTVTVGTTDPADAPELLWRPVGETAWRRADQASPPLAFACGQHIDVTVIGMSTSEALEQASLLFTPGELEPCPKDPPGGAPGTSGASGTDGGTPLPSDEGSEPAPTPPPPPSPPPSPPPGPPPTPPGPGGGSTGGQGGQKPPAGGGGQAPPPDGGASQGDWGGEIPIDERRLGWRPPTGGWLGDGYGHRPGGHGNGDPHYVTGDGVFYSTQHVGEFWALTGPEDMAIQVRQSAWKESDSIASISAVALKVGAARVSVTALPQPEIRLEGTPVAATAPFQRIALAGGGRLEISREGAAIRTVLAVWPDGSTLLMDMLDGWIDLDLQLAATRETHGHRGLLGAPDDDPANDLRPRSGAALNPNESAQVVTFVNAWRIRPEESLFDYPAGRTAASYQDLGFPREPAAPTASALTGARNTCTSRGVADPMLLTACAFDLAMTGETGLLDSHRERQRGLNRIRRVFDRELDPDIGGAEPLASNAMIEMQLRPGQSRTFAVEVTAPQKLNAYPADVSCVDDDDGETSAYQWFDARGRPLSKAKRTCGDVVSEEEVAPGRYYLVVRGPRTGPAVPVAFQAYLVE